MRYPVGAIVVGALAAMVVATILAGGIARLGRDTRQESARYGCIDGLRGYLALCVMVHHFVIWLQITRLGGTWSAPRIALFNQLGGGMVALFFMVTGFLFYPRVLKGFAGNDWGSVLISRVMRIVPLTFASFIVVSIISAARVDHASFDRSYLRAALLWVSSASEPPLFGYRDSKLVNADVLWSLRYEWFFYLVILPTTAWLIDRVRGHGPTWSVPLAVLLSLILIRLIFGDYISLARFTLFFVGMIGYELQRREAIVALLRWPGTAVIAAIGLVLAVTIWPSPYDLAMPAFALFFFAVSAGNSFFGIFSTPGSVLLGDCSFGIYLLHGIVLNLIFVDGASLIAPVATDYLPIVLPLVAIAVVPVTFATYHSIERPGMAAGHRLADRWRQRRSWRMRGSVKVPS